MSTFDLNALIRQELDESAVADPYIVARHVRKRIAPEDEGAALDACLPAVVTDIARLHRSPTTPPPGKNRKAAAVEWYQRILRQRIQVDHDGRAWKFLGDVTRDELLVAASVRREIAAATLARAHQLEQLAAAMDECAAETVSDLPPDALEVLR